MNAAHFMKLSPLKKREKVISQQNLLITISQLWLTRSGRGGGGSKRQRIHAKAVMYL